jgi:hypothetical protein
LPGARSRQSRPDHGRIIKAVWTIVGLRPRHVPTTSPHRRHDRGGLGRANTACRNAATPTPTFTASSIPRPSDTLYIDGDSPADPVTHPASMLALAIADVWACWTKTTVLARAGFEVLLVNATARLYRSAPLYDNAFRGCGHPLKSADIKRNSLLPPPAAAVDVEAGPGKLLHCL